MEQTIGLGTGSGGSHRTSYCLRCYRFAGTISRCCGTTYLFANFTGADIAVRAVGAGHRAAASIDQYLKGEEVVGLPELWSVSMGALDEVPEARFEGIEKIDRHEQPELGMNERVCTFKEVELCFSEQAAVEEAQRCLTCDCDALDDCQLREYAME